ncbi:hypothetical protein QLL89_002571 [Yersinia enterocolitica]|uniref:hypothetical protein n=1 Tax=Yersinia sp. 22-579 TaxID=3057580 RepID=UPI00263B9A1F|nr:hypothetical protein [Yersinia sp. 22-579]ELW7376314.1 hypothetical protein [Yersinia enterocolitica]HDL6777726.1 hypothetical protein [Yersinia enterocolitica]HDL7635065.1 hypothetical protein [Yersinia enterocolitica]HDY4940583.1 hypothetical protein [Yersinia enterocolitica]
MTFVCSSWLLSFGGCPSLCEFYRGKGKGATTTGGTQGRRLRRAIYPCGHPGGGATSSPPREGLPSDGVPNCTDRMNTPRHDGTAGRP